MKQSIGLYWVVLQGFLYILGAVIYAVRYQLSQYHNDLAAMLTNGNRLVYQRDFSPEDSMSGGAHIRSFMFS